MASCRRKDTSIIQLNMLIIIGTLAGSMIFCTAAVPADKPKKETTAAQALSEKPENENAQKDDDDNAADDDGDETAAEKPEKGAVTLKNAGFENARTGWNKKDFNRFKNIVGIDRSRSHNGNLSVAINNADGTENGFLSRDIARLKPGAVYHAIVWVRGDAETVPSLATLQLSFLDEEGKKVRHHATRKQPPLDGSWGRLNLRAFAPPTTSRGRLTLQLFGPGSVWFDDVKLSVAKSAAPLMVSPPRIAVQPAKKATATFNIILQKASNAEATPEIDCKLTGNRRDAKARDIDVSFEKVGARKLAATAELPPLKAGCHTLECALSKTTDTPAALNICVPLKNRKPQGLSPDGNVLTDGKPFFPIGLYHVPPSGYERVARRGFNCVQGIADRSPQLLDKNLKMAVEANLKLEVPLYAGGYVKGNLRNSKQRLRMFDDHPGVVSWKIFDEPSMHWGRGDELAGAYNTLRRQSRGRPLVLTLARSDRYHFWANFCDVMQVTAYPLPEEPLTIIADRLSDAKQALQPWQNLTAVLQAGWQEKPMNQPTFRQARTMVYLAIINGARGIFWYTFRDPGWQLADTPLWEKFKDINRETKAIAKPVLHGEKTDTITVDSDNDDLHWLARRHEDKTYVLVANPVDAPAEITVTAEKTITGAPTMLGSPASIDKNAAKLTLEPEDANAVILQFEKGQPDSSKEDRAQSAAPADKKPASNSD